MCLFIDINYFPLLKHVHLPLFILNVSMFRLTLRTFYYNDVTNFILLTTTVISSLSLTPRLRHPDSAPLQGCGTGECDVHLPCSLLLTS